MHNHVITLAVDLLLSKLTGYIYSHVTDLVSRSQQETGFKVDGGAMLSPELTLQNTRGDG